MSKHLTQGSDDWISMRRSYIGASDAAAIMGVSPWRTPKELFLEKTGQGKPQETNSAMRRGIDLEEEARQAFEKITGHIVFPKVVFSKEFPWLMASLDGMTMDENVIVEIKCAGKEDHEIAWKGGIPEKYWPQVQQQMIVTGLKKCMYYGYSPRYMGLNNIVYVEYNEEYCQELIAKTKRFWDCMKSGILSDEFKDKKKPIVRNDEAFCLTLKRYLMAKDILESQKLDLDYYKERLVELCDENNYEAMGHIISKHERIGSIDYSKIPELKGVDLEKYRKPSSEYWSIK